MRLLAVAAVALAGSACGGDGPTPPSGPASLNVTPTELRFIRIGDTARVTAAPKDESGNPVTADISWSSSNVAVASVADQGNSALVTANAFGTATITASAGGSVTQTINVRVEQPQFNVNAEKGCSEPIMRAARFETQSAHLAIYSDTSNPPGGFSLADYEAFTTKFEELVWPVLTLNFGVPFDIDNNGRVIAFFTKAVNELTPANSQSVVGGFFYGRDLFPKTGSDRLQRCATSNEAEMFYMLVPDPNGAVNGNVRTLDQVRKSTMGVIGHEFQHLINSSRRLFVNTTAMYPETDYMEEGLSHIAEELLFYSASGLTPKMNISIDTLRATQQRLDAVNAYQTSNLGRFRNYLRAPSSNSPYQADAGGPDLETRGAAWSWLRYLADRPASVTPSPACSATVALDPRTTCLLEGSAAAQFTVTPGSNAGEFTIVAFASGAAVTATAAATGAVAVTGPPTPGLSPGGTSFARFGASSGSAFSARGDLVLDQSFHLKLRAIERRELRALVPYARAWFASRAIPKPSRSSSPDFVPPSGASFASAPFVEPVWARLVNSNDTGFKNLQGVFGQDLLTPTRDWAVANYTDDAVFRILDQYTHPSWHFRSLIPIINTPDQTYPLQTLSLTSQQQVSLVNGGAAYLRLGVAAGSSSTVTFSVNGGAPPASLKLVIVRTK